MRVAKLLIVFSEPGEEGQQGGGVVACGTAVASDIRYYEQEIFSRILDELLDAGGLKLIEYTQLRKFLVGRSELDELIQMQSILGVCLEVLGCCSP